MSHISLVINPCAPFRLDLTAWVLPRLADNVIDRWDGGTYRRMLLMKGNPVAVAVVQTGTLEKPLLVSNPSCYLLSRLFFSALSLPTSETPSGLPLDLYDLLGWACAHARSRSGLGAFIGHALFQPARTSSRVCNRNVVGGCVEVRYCPYAGPAIGAVVFDFRARPHSLRSALRSFGTEDESADKPNISSRLQFYVLYWCFSPPNCRSTGEVLRHKEALRCLLRHLPGPPAPLYLRWILARARAGPDDESLSRDDYDGACSILSSPGFAMALGPHHQVPFQVFLCLCEFPKKRRRFSSSMSACTVTGGKFSDWDIFLKNHTALQG